MQEDSLQSTLHRRFQKLQCFFFKIALGFPLCKDIGWCKASFTLFVKKVVVFEGLKKISSNDTVGIYIWQKLAERDPFDFFDPQW